MDGESREEVGGVDRLLMVTLAMMEVAQEELQKLHHKIGVCWLLHLPLVCLLLVIQYNEKCYKSQSMKFSKPKFKILFI